ncbi:MAG: class I tRNA ligase family protein [bacterium]|nr:class I tRNA ligase family protein [bacterium]
MSKYDHQKIEKKWQKRWEKEKSFIAEFPSEKPKWYSLIEFPYPSGDGLHVGHIRSNTAIDIISRKRRMEGYNVLYPIGWDAFGLPTENYAIKTGLAPQVVTKKNTDIFRRQLKSLGFSFDWDREINTTDPEYYKWTQWMFLKFFEKGLAYKAKVAINWCPKDKIGLANEEAAGGVCDRCGGPVEKRMKEQWMIKITAYADKLLEGLKDVDYIPQAKIQQDNWIGRSEGAEIEFPIVIASEAKQSHFKIASSLSAPRNDLINVFTTRPDTILGATYVVLSPEHKLIGELENRIENLADVKNYIAAAAKKSDIERTEEGKQKTGVELKGITAINPATKEEIPVWVADYVLTGYGTGAIMAVPQHDQRDREFAEKFKLPIVDKPLVSWEEALKVTDGKKTVKYKLRDWVFSRQRYWGEPIPLIHCEQCNWVAVPEKDLPVKLPKVAKYQPTDTGESPLAAMTKWVNVKCPRCGGPAKRETDTMPNWAGSSWYFLAYIIRGESANYQLPITNYFDAFKYFTPVDWYNGGMEHTVLHLLYSRFWNRFLYDLGLVPVAEPYKKRTSHGLILGEDGVKMSKSRGNVINPDGLVKEFGADSLRLYEMFMGPFDQAIAWDPRGILGTSRFLERVWQIGTTKTTSLHSQVFKDDVGLERLLHQTIKKVSEDIETMSFNTAISAMMIFVNECVAKQTISQSVWQKFVLILAPFAPHIAEELWEVLGNKNSIHLESWPKFDPNKIVEDSFELIIQVNGKMRGKANVPIGTPQDEAEKLALEQSSVKKWIEQKTFKKVIFVKDRLINFIV